MPRVTDFVEGPVTPLVEAVRQLQGVATPPLRTMPTSDSVRIAALEARVAELERSLAETRRLTLGARFAHSPDSEDRP